MSAYSAGMMMSALNHPSPTPFNFGYFPTNGVHWFCNELHEHCHLQHHQSHQDHEAHHIENTHHNEGDNNNNQHHHLNLHFLHITPQNKHLTPSPKSPHDLFSKSSQLSQNQLDTPHPSHPIYSRSLTTSRRMTNSQFDTTANRNIPEEFKKRIEEENKKCVIDIHLPLQDSIYSRRSSVASSISEDEKDQSTEQGQRRRGSSLSVVLPDCRTTVVGYKEGQERRGNC